MDSIQRQREAQPYLEVRMEGGFQSTNVPLRNINTIMQILCKQLKTGGEKHSRQQTAGSVCISHLKLSSTCVNTLVAGRDAERTAVCSHCHHGRAGQAANLHQRQNTGRCDVDGGGDDKSRQWQR